MQLDLGQKIRDLRRRDGRTQEALAEVGLKQIRYVCSPIGRITDMWLNSNCLK